MAGPFGYLLRWNAGVVLTAARWRVDAAHFTATARTTDSSRSSSPGSAAVVVWVVLGSDLFLGPVDVDFAFPVVHPVNRPNGQHDLAPEDLRTGVHYQAIGGHEGVVLVHLADRPVGGLDLVPDEAGAGALPADLDVTEVIPLLPSGSRRTRGTDGNGCISPS